MTTIGVVVVGLVAAGILFVIWECYNAPVVEDIVTERKECKKLRPTKEKKLSHYPKHTHVELFDPEQDDAE